MSAPVTSRAGDRVNVSPIVAVHEPLRGQLRSDTAASLAAHGLTARFTTVDPFEADSADATRVRAAIIGPPVGVTAHIRTIYPGLVVVVSPSVGTDHIDTDALARQGIEVLSLTDYCTDEVADHALALTLAALRHLRSGDLAARTGTWALAGIPRLVAGTSLGLIGFGRIARAFAARATALGMTVRAVDPTPGDDVFARAGVDRCASLAELLPLSTVLSLHVPLTADTRHLIDAAALAALPARSIVVNVSRGGLIDETALAAALRSGHVSAAGIDTFEVEPPDGTSPLLSCEHALLTPHIAWLSERSPARAMQQAVGLVAATLAPVDDQPTPHGRTEDRSRR